MDRNAESLLSKIRQVLELTDDDDDDIVQRSCKSLDAKLRDLCETAWHELDPLELLSIPKELTTKKNAVSSPAKPSLSTNCGTAASSKSEEGSTEGIIFRHSSDWKRVEKQCRTLCALCCHLDSLPSAWTLLCQKLRTTFKGQIIDSLLQLWVSILQVPTMSVAAQHQKFFCVATMACCVVGVALSPTGEDAAGEVPWDDFLKRSDNNTITAVYSFFENCAPLALESSCGLLYETALFCSLLAISTLIPTSPPQQLDSATAIVERLIERSSACTMPLAHIVTLQAAQQVAVASNYNQVSSDLYLKTLSSCVERNAFAQVQFTFESLDHRGIPQYVRRFFHRALAALLCNTFNCVTTNLWSLLSDVGRTLTDLTSLVHCIAERWYKCASRVSQQGLWEGWKRLHLFLRSYCLPPQAPQASEKSMFMHAAYYNLLAAIAREDLSSAKQLFVEDMEDECKRINIPSTNLTSIEQLLHCAASHADGADAILSRYSFMLFLRELSLHRAIEPNPFLNFINKLFADSRYLLVQYTLKSGNELHTTASLWDCCHAFETSALMLHGLLLERFVDFMRSNNVDQIIRDVLSYASVAWSQPSMPATAFTTLLIEMEKASKAKCRRWSSVPPPIGCAANGAWVELTRVCFSNYDASDVPLDYVEACVCHLGSLLHQYILVATFSHTLPLGLPQSHFLERVLECLSCILCRFKSTASLFLTLRDTSEWAASSIFPCGNLCATQRSSIASLMIALLFEAGIPPAQAEKIVEILKVLVSEGQPLFDCARITFSLRDSHTALLSAIHGSAFRLRENSAKVVCSRVSFLEVALRHDYRLCRLLCEDTAQKNSHPQRTLPGLSNGLVSLEDTTFSLCEEALVLEIPEVVSRCFELMQTVLELGEVEQETINMIAAHIAKARSLLQRLVQHEVEAQSVHIASLCASVWAVSTMRFLRDCGSEQPMQDKVLQEFVLDVGLSAADNGKYISEVSLLLQRYGAQSHDAGFNGIFGAFCESLEALAYGFKMAMECGGQSSSRLGSVARITESCHLFEDATAVLLVTAIDQFRLQDAALKKDSSLLRCLRCVVALGALFNSCSLQLPSQHVALSAALQQTASLVASIVGEASQSDDVELISSALQALVVGSRYIASSATTLQACASLVTSWYYTKIVSAPGSSTLSLLGQSILSFIKTFSVVDLPTAHSLLDIALQRIKTLSSQLKADKPLDTQAEAEMETLVDLVACAVSLTSANWKLVTSEHTMHLVSTMKGFGEKRPSFVAASESRVHRAGWHAVWCCMLRVLSLLVAGNSQSADPQLLKNTFLMLVKMPRVLDCLANPIPQDKTGRIFPFDLRETSAILHLFVRLLVTSPRLVEDSTPDVVGALKRGFLVLHGSGYNKVRNGVQLCRKTLVGSSSYSSDELFSSILREHLEIQLLLADEAYVDVTIETVARSSTPATAGKQQITFELLREFIQQQQGTVIRILKDVEKDPVTPQMHAIMDNRTSNTKCGSVTNSTDRELQPSEDGVGTAVTGVCEGHEDSLENYIGALQAALFLYLKYLRALLQRRNTSHAQRALCKEACEKLRSSIDRVCRAHATSPSVAFLVSFLNTCRLSIDRLAL